MKRKPSNLFLLLAVTCIATAATATAADIYWDSNGTTAGAGTAPSGNWGTDVFWSNDATGASATTATWNSADTAVFSAGSDATSPYTITLNADTTAAGLKFEEGNVTFVSATSAKSLTLNSDLDVGSRTVIFGNATATTSVNLLLGTNSVTLNSGALDLYGNNTMSSALLKGGTATIGNANAFGTTATVTMGNTAANSTVSLRMRNLTLSRPIVLQSGTGFTTNATLNNVGFLSPIVTGGITSTGSGTTNLTIDSVISGSGSSLTFTVSGANPINHIGALSLRNTGTGTASPTGTIDVSAPIGSNVTSVTVSDISAGVKGLQRVILGSTANAWTSDTTIDKYDYVESSVPKTNYARLQLAASEVIPHGSGKGNVTVIGTLDLAGFSETINGLSGTGIVDSTAGTTNTLTVGSNNATSTFSGTIKNTTSTLALTKTGSGILTLSGTNTYTGNTLVSQGILALGSNTALQNSALDTSGAGTVSVTGFTTPTLGGLTGSVNLASVITTGYSSVTALTLNPLAGSQTYSGVIANGTMTLTKTGAGTQTLSGASANTYTGLTTVSAGTLSLAKNNGVTAIAGNILVNGTGILSTTINASGRIADASNVTVDGASAQFQVGYNQNDTINTLAVNNGGRVILGEAGVGFYSVLGTNAGITSTGGGSIRFSNSALNQIGLDFNGGIRTVDVAANTLTIDVGIKNGGLTKIGNGTLALNGSASNYTGNTLVSQGILALGSNTALQNSALDTSGAGTVSVTGFTTPTLGGLTGSVNLASVITTGYSSVTALTLNPSGSQTYSGVIANGTMTLTKTGAGTQTLSGASANTYTGLTTVSAGTLSLDKNDGVTAIAGNILVNGTGILSTTINKSGRIADTSNVTVDGSSAQFQVGYNQNDTINTLAVNNGGRVTLGETGGSFYAVLGTNAGITSTGGGSIRFSNLALNQTGLDFKGGIRTVDVADNTLTLDVGIKNGGLTKIGNGTLALNGANTYTGNTTVTGGTLSLANASLDDASTVSIASSATLNLTHSNIDTVGSLFINGVQKANGIYKSVGAAGVGTELASLTGTGKLQVGPANTFASWISDFSFSAFPGANLTATGDADRDGISNLVEAIFGTAPNAATTGLTQIGATPTSLTFKHPLNPNLTGDVTYSYQWSSNLADWKSSGESSGGTTATISASLPAAGIVTVTTTSDGPAAKIFVRIIANQAP